MLCLLKVSPAVLAGHALLTGFCFDRIVFQNSKLYYMYVPLRLILPPFIQFISHLVEINIHPTLSHSLSFHSFPSNCSFLAAAPRIELRFFFFNIFVLEYFVHCNG